MKVFSNRNKTVPFSEIENAECFLFAGLLWFKTTHIQGTADAISLEYGNTRFFPSDDYVIKVDAQVTIE
jgi:hypothetical protein